MFDFDRLKDMAAGFLGGSNPVQAVAENLGAGNVMDMIQNAGLTPEMFEGLDAQQVLGLMAENGIDVSQFAPEQLQNLLSGLNIDAGNLGEIGNSVLGFLDRR
jgi:hypothetical protein